MQAFSSYFSSLSKFYGKRSESYRACNVRYRNFYFYSLFIVYMDNY